MSTVEIGRAPGDAGDIATGSLPEVIDRGAADDAACPDDQYVLVCHEITLKACYGEFNRHRLKSHEDQVELDGDSR